MATRCTCVFQHTEHRNDKPLALACSSCGIAVTDFKNKKAQFKLALGSYLNTHTCDSVDEFFMFKDDP